MDKLDNFLKQYIEDEYSQKVLKDFDTLYRDLIIPDLAPIKKYLEKFKINNPEIFTNVEILKNEQIDSYLIKALEDDEDTILGAIYLLFKVVNDNILKQLLKFLSHKNPKIRLQVVHGLGQLKDKRTVKYVIKMLKDTETDIVKEALWALGEIGDKLALKYLLSFIKNEKFLAETTNALWKLNDPSISSILIKLIDNSNGVVRAHAIYGLGKLHIDSAVDKIIPKLKDSIQKVVDIAAYSLGELGSKKALVPLIEALRDIEIDEDTIVKAIVKIIEKNGGILPQALIKYFYDEDFYIRSILIKITGKIKDKRALKPIIEIIKESDVIMIDEIIETLVNMADKNLVLELYNIKNQSDDMVKQTIDQTFSKLGEDITSAYLLDSFQENKTAIDEFQKELSQKGKNVKELLLKALKNENRYVVCSAIRSLSNFKDKAIVNEIREFLLSDDILKKQCAIYALSIMEDRGSIKIFEEILKSEKEENLLIETLNALASFKSKSSIEPIIGVIENRELDMIVRLRAADVLIKYGENVVDRVVELLESKDDFVRETSSYILGKIGGDAVVMILSAMLKDSNISVSNMAGHSLHEIASPLSIMPMIVAFKEKKIREDSFYGYIVELAKKEIGVVFDFLQDAGDSAGIMIRAVGESKNENAIPYLQKLLDKKLNVRDVIMALGLLDNNRCVEIIKPYLNSDEIDIKNIAKWAYERYTKEYKKS